MNGRDPVVSEMNFLKKKKVETAEMEKWKWKTWIVISSSI